MEKMPAPKPVPGWLTLSEAALYLSKPNSWIYDNVQKMGIPCSRLGKQYRFKVDLLDEWMLSRMDNPF